MSSTREVVKVAIPTLRASVTVFKDAMMCGNKCGRVLPQKFVTLKCMHYLCGVCAKAMQQPPPSLKICCPCCGETTSDLTVIDPFMSLVLDNYPMKAACGSEAFGWWAVRTHEQGCSVCESLVQNLITRNEQTAALVLI